MIIANMTVSIPKLIVCPITLTAESDADADGVSSFGTFPMIAFVFGEENIPNPTPCKNIDIEITRIEVFLSKKQSIPIAIVTSVIPIADNICGVILSDNLPENGDTIVIISGQIIKIIPDVCESSPIMYWK